MELEDERENEVIDDEVHVSSSRLLEGENEKRKNIDLDNKDLDDEVLDVEVRPRRRGR